MLQCGTHEVAGELASAADPAITRLRFWSYNAGTGSVHDAFVNDIALSGGWVAATSDVVRIVRAGTLIPQSWRDRHDLSGPDSDDQDDPDHDGLTNLQEYWADTHPTSGSSWFGVSTIAQAGADGETETVRIEIAGPTTNSRLYDVDYASNLLDRAWWPLGYNVAGNGSNIVFVITNPSSSTGARFYRTKVILP